MERIQVELVQSSRPFRLGVPQGCGSMPQLFVVEVAGVEEFLGPPDSFNQSYSKLSESHLNPD